MVLVALLEELAHGVLHDPAELGDLNAMGADRQIDTGAHQQNQHDGTPREIVQHLVDVCNDF